MNSLSENSLSSNMNGAKQLLKFISGPAVSVCLQSNTLLSCNHSAAKLLGFTNKDFYGRKAEELIFKYSSLKREALAHSQNKNSNPVISELILASGDKLDAKLTVIPFNSNQTQIVLISINPIQTQNFFPSKVDFQHLFFTKNPLPLIMVSFNTFEIVSVNP